jgi:hypothetical protein
MAWSCRSEQQRCSFHCDVTGLSRLVEIPVFVLYRAWVMRATQQESRIQVLKTPGEINAPNSHCCGGSALLGRKRHFCSKRHSSD